MKYIHIRHKDHSSAITIAYYYSDKKIKYGLSFCSKHDQFCKRKGRELAKHRCLDPASYEYGYVHNSIDLTYTNISSKILSMINHLVTKQHQLLIEDYLHHND